MSIEYGAIVGQLKLAQDQTTQLAPLTSQYRDFTLSKAYQVAALIHEQRLIEGWHPVGRKIGFTNAEMWSVYGVKEPVWSFIYDRTVVHTGGSDGICNLANYAEPKIEPELVFRLKKVPPVNADLTTLRACIDWVGLGFEIVQSHFSGWKFQAADTVADRGLHAELRLAQPRPIMELGSDIEQVLAEFEVTLFCDDKPCGQGKGENALGSPLKALSHLLSVLNEQSMPLQAGEIITTGTLTPAFTVTSGQVWRLETKGIALPGLQVYFVNEKLS